METVIRNVGDLSESGRSAAESLVGHSLGHNQQLVIQIVDAAAPPSEVDTAIDQKLPAWCDVYAGLDDVQIAALEQAISRRLDLTSSKI